MATLDLNRETVEFLIDKAREFQERDEVTFPDQPESPTGDHSRRMSEDFGGDPYYGELVSTIEDLDPDQQVSLVALMWLGRGDYSIDEWDDALEHAGDSWNDHTADYLIGTPLLPDYLAEGLETFETEQED
jgi:hypothetical protein